MPNISTGALILSTASLLAGVLIPGVSSAQSNAGQPVSHDAPSFVAPRRSAFNDDWRFFRGEAAGAEQPEFDDHAWTTLRLPHDWAIEGPFDPALNPHTGALPISVIGWYRKTFEVAADAPHRYYSIEFDGAMANSRVWLNGHELGGRPYGYIGFAFDLTPYLHADGAPNVIAVRLARRY